jgi:hypothetical protein
LFKTQDDCTFMLCVAVCALKTALGRRWGLDEAACREAGMTGLLADTCHVGQIAFSGALKT